MRRAVAVWLAFFVVLADACRGGEPPRPVLLRPARVFDGADPGAWGPWSGSGPGTLPGATTALSTDDKTTGTTSLKLTNATWSQNVAHQAGIQAEKDAWAANSVITFDVFDLPQRILER